MSNENLGELRSTIMSGHTPALTDLGLFRSSVFWALAPYGYILNRYSNSDEIPLNDDNETPAVFELVRVSAELVDTGLHKLSRFIVLQEGKLDAAYHFELPLPDDMSEEDRRRYIDSANFEVDNGFGAPNAEDEFEVEYALKQAYLDGTEPV